MPIPVDDRRGQGNIRGNDQITRRHIVRDIVIRFIETTGHLDGSNPG